MDWKPVAHCEVGHEKGGARPCEERFATVLVIEISPVKSTCLFVCEAHALASERTA